MIFDTSGLVCCAIYMILLINDGLVFNARLHHIMYFYQCKIIFMYYDILEW